jgi:hypothetical protein
MVDRETCPSVPYARAASTTEVALGIGCEEVFMKWFTKKENYAAKYVQSLTDFIALCQKYVASCKQNQDLVWENSVLRTELETFRSMKQMLDCVKTQPISKWIN